VEQLTRTQQVVLWLAAAVVGLVLAAILHAGWLASVGLVAAVGIAIGFGFAAGQRLSGRSDRDAD
jgi:VIT1/CCC1 family predicted Fe2+/Mn2+ transporter